MIEIRASDLPREWTVGRSPLDKGESATLDGILALGGRGEPPAAWHEAFTPEGRRVLFRVVEGVEYNDQEGEVVESPPYVDAVIAAPVWRDDDVFAESSDSVDGAMLRAIRIEDLSRALTARWAAESRIGGLKAMLGERADEPLRKPDRSDPAKFAAHVALRYLQLLEKTPNPTKAIADETGAQHTAAQRWVVDARRRGYLPPATRKGRTA